MNEAVKEVKNFRMKSRIDINPSYDPNYTGLIGDSYSPITTSRGSLRAKRTTVNPNFAALIVYMLLEARVKKGDSIAIGASASFPALFIASISAAKALQLKPVIICSLGSSQWGANLIEMTLLDIHLCLNDAKIFNYRIHGISLGGDLDVGEEMESQYRSLLIDKVKKNEIPFIDEPKLEKNVQIRMTLYDRSKERSNFSAFINIGGSHSNMGVHSDVLKLSPGVNFIEKLPPKNERGIIHEMAERKIPVIHLLNIKGLSRKYGLQWDPMPLPEIGEGRIYLRAKYKENNWNFYIIIISYFMTLAVLLIFNKKIVKWLPFHYINTNLNRRI